MCTIDHLMSYLIGLHIRLFICLLHVPCHLGDISKGSCPILGLTPHNSWKRYHFCRPIYWGLKGCEPPIWTMIDMSQNYISTIKSWDGKQTPTFCESRLPWSSPASRSRSLLAQGHGDGYGLQLLYFHPINRYKLGAWTCMYHHLPEIFDVNIFGCDPQQNILFSVKTSNAGRSVMSISDISGQTFKRAPRVTASRQCDFPTGISPWERSVIRELPSGDGRF